MDSARVEFGFGLFPMYNTICKRLQLVSIDMLLDNSKAAEAVMKWFVFVSEVLDLTS